MKRIFLIFSIILILGCINQTDYGKGVEIDSFQVVPDKISAGQKTLVSVNVVNKGAIDILQKDERKAYITLFGVGDEWIIEKEPSVIGPFDLRAVQPVYNIPAGSKAVTWIVDSNHNLPEDQTFTSEFQVRVCYDYYTEVVGKVELISENEWISRFGEIKQHQIEIDQTAGPLNIKIDSSQPIIVSEEGSRIDLELELENVGGGTITKPDYNCEQTNSNEEEPRDYLNYAKIESVMIGNTALKCNMEEGDRTVFFSKGKTGKFVCTGTYSGTFPEQKIDLRMKIVYKYYKDAKANVEVTGIRKVEG